MSLRSGSVSSFRLASLGLWLVISIRNVVSSTGIEDVPICTALIGVFLLAMFTVGYFKAQLAWYMRILAFAGALGLMIPGTISGLCGLAILALIYFVQKAKEKKLSANAAA